ncbi:inositol monophosphatase family protein [Hirschia litorea]|uniref:Inositol monophosphatase family protein n=1 Tax=Hirschia litorea TaxID=1199156 RepID=A0ABW2IJI5_9PROT
MLDSNEAARIEDDLKLLRDVAREAGELAMNWFHAGAKQWDKSPNNPVTQADIAVNDRIAQRLLSERPTYGWLSEETKDDAENRDMSRVFVVDPIDGTKAFIAGQPFFCVSIALLDHDVSVAGVVYNPSTDEMFEAQKGGGARLNGVPIFASQTDQIANCKMIGHHRQFEPREGMPAWPDMELADPIPNAVAYRIALVASGKWDAVIALGNKCDWDLAAASLILKEAGGACCDHKGREYTFNGRIPVQRSVVGAGKNLQPLLLDKVRLASIFDPKGEDVVESQTQNSNHARMKLDPMNTKAPNPSKQLLHLVIGGELKDVTGIEFEDLKQVEFVGAFGSHEEAYNAWKAAAQRTVDNAEMRFFILHAHRLMDPETGHSHDV